MEIETAYEDLPIDLKQRTAADRACRGFVTLALLAAMLTITLFVRHSDNATAAFGAVVTFGFCGVLTHFFKHSAPDKEERTLLEDPLAPPRPDLGSRITQSK